MPTKIAINFLEKLLKNLNIQMLRFRSDLQPEMDLGLRNILGVQKPAHRPFADLEGNTVYFLKDLFGCNYSCFLIPESDEVMLVGPYLIDEKPDHAIMTLLKSFRLPPALMPTLRLYYSNLPLMTHDSLMITLLNTLGEMLWGNIANFKMKWLESNIRSIEPLLDKKDCSKIYDAMNIRILEKRYEHERLLLYAVSNGMTHQAKMIISMARVNTFEKRIPDPVCNQKYYMIAFNTLLRKAAEHGGVHPLNIEQLSSALVHKINTNHSLDTAKWLINFMVQEYCILVNRHSIKHYSPLVQHVILRIKDNLAADLSLKAHAGFLFVNPSYLSTLFKRETGITLTDYVIKRRVEYASFLLSSTNLPVQTISAYCGIEDVNYFCKTYKRVAGKTPTAYRTDARRMEMHIKRSEVSSCV